MLRNPCALRSAQCAALIALAAAAGLSRFEAPKGRGDSESAGTCCSAGENPASLSSPAARFAFDSHPTCLAESSLLQKWLFLFATANDRSPEESHRSGSRKAFANEIRRNAHAFRYDNTFDRSFEVCFFRASSATTAVMLDASAGWPAAPLAWPARSILSVNVRPPWLEVSLPHHSSARHDLPWSVGPPRHRIELDPSAVRTFVPGDSAVRSLSRLRVARQNLESSAARVTRPYRPPQSWEPGRDSQHPRGPEIRATRNTPSPMPTHLRWPAAPGAACPPA